MLPNTSPTQTNQDRLPSQQRIRLLVCDIDGTLSKGSTHPIPMRVLQRLHDTNTRSKTDPDFPAIVFLTGRTQPYIECLMQVIDAHLPSICENGTVLFEPTRYEIQLHPSFTQHEQRAIEQMRQILDEEFLRPGLQHEPGKFTHFTLLVGEPHTPAGLLDHALELAQRLPGWFHVEATKSCIHFLLTHIHKGLGVDWLSAITGVSPEQMAGMGDARPDLPFLRKVGIACAPANSHPDVKLIAHWTSELEDGEAAIEFLDRVVDHNRSLTRAEILARTPQLIPQST
jgi:hydroxymethylpyrimidine pyrophosphatase-like HAD family hydrolase